MKSQTKIEDTLKADRVLEYAKKKAKPFTTAEIANRFKKRLTQAAAAIAILRIARHVIPATPPKTPDGISRWQLV